MKNRITLGFIICAALAALWGCAGSTPKGAVEAPPMSLDLWLKEEIYGKLPETLKTNSFMKDRPFIIVKARGEVVDDHIDKLTEEIREQLYAILLESPEIRVVRRHPARVIERPYALQEIRCGRFSEHDMLLMFDIKGLGDPEDRLAWVNVRALDRSRDTWIRGFSLHRRVTLSPHQSRALHAPPYPDQDLRGLKYVPFTESQRDEMAAYLVQNLSCILRARADERGMGDIKVFVDPSRVRGSNRDTVWFIRNQLQFCNEILVVDSEDEAEWILDADSRETGAGSGLSQFWLTARNARGIATYAYFLSGRQRDSHFSGRWEIRDPVEGVRMGQLVVRKVADDGYRADLYGSDGTWIRKRNIVIRRSNRSVGWSYYDRELRRTYDADGVIVEGGRRITVTMSSFPPSEVRQLELVLLD